ncbi:MAG TPA: PQQ-dependent sugar dehydrogenase, partial [Actinomycetota bacterium]|nr:PQQ-dependent sugar dehydrogenase [Actinomycetota bacterium]
PAPTGPGPGPTTTVGPSPGPSPDLDAVRVRLVEVARLGQPLALAVRPGDQALYVAEKDGLVRAVRGGRVDPEPVLDLRGQVSQGLEQGLLGLAFSPDGRYLYVNYTDLAGDTRVVEYAVVEGRADPGSRREVLFVDQPYPNHNGGNLAFGPDGYLYVGLGDGGSANDPHGFAQDLGSLLGKLLRIDPRPFGGRPYGVPPDNPFVGRPGARPEIWAYGLRNPWRFSFDRQTGDLWIGDVGQSSREEVDFVPAGTAGANFGWDHFEGSLLVEGDPIPGAVMPIHEYPTGPEGRSVIGGYVYRGSAIPALVGAYLYSDFYNPRIVALVRQGRGVADLRVVHQGVEATASFGEGPDGELYVLSLAGGVYRIEPTT